MKNFLLNLLLALSCILYRHDLLASTAGLMQELKTYDKSKISKQLELLVNQEKFNAVKKLASKVIKSDDKKRYLQLIGHWE